MVAIESSMKPLGWPLPHFRLDDPFGVPWDSGQLPSEAPGFLVQFICNHCPYVIHVADVLGQLTSEWMSEGLVVVGINSNDAVAYPDDAPARMPSTASRFGWGFPYLVDSTAEVARLFDAQCTPDFFLFDAHGALAYRGRFDSSTPGNNNPVTGAELRGAVESLLAGRPIPAEQLPSIGCSIKWPAAPSDSSK